SDIHGTGVLAADDPLVGLQPPSDSTSFAITVPIGFQSINHFLAVASDVAGNQSAAAVVPTITNPFPQPSSRDQTNHEGDVVNVPPFLRFGPPDFYSAIGLPPGLHIDPLSGVISGTLTGQSAGTYFPTVTDNAERSAGELTFLWTVTDVTS